AVAVAVFDPVAHEAGVEQARRLAGYDLDVLRHGHLPVVVAPDRAVAVPLPAAGVFAEAGCKLRPAAGRFAEEVFLAVEADAGVVRPAVLVKREALGLAGGGGVVSHQSESHGRVVENRVPAAPRVRLAVHDRPQPG